jgi:gamma-glutamyl-gamma-aminobutyrate hydrolase PuuD
MKLGSIIYSGCGEIFPDPFPKVLYDPEDVKRYDMLMLHGGEDISPALYNQKVVHADAKNTPSDRDLKEVDILLEAVRLGIPIFGVCRGLQLLCAMSGGSLFQHVEGHGTSHKIKVHTGDEFTSNSCHHQAVRLNGEGVVLATTPTRIAYRRYADKIAPEDSNEPEVEAAWFPSLHAVAVQGHPEWLHKNSNLVNYSRLIVEEYLGVQVRL